MSLAPAIKLMVGIPPIKMVIFLGDGANELAIPTLEIRLLSDSELDPSPAALINSWPPPPDPTAIPTD